MNKKLKLLALSTLIALTITSTGCSILFKEPTAEPEPKKIETPDTNPEEDKKAQKFLEDYFAALYSQPIEKYSENVTKGIIPQNILDFIAKRTIDEGNNNSEIGIHLPRMVEINGLTITSYEILNANDKLSIESSFIGKKDESYLYFVKIGFKAKGLPNSIFNQYYQQNKDTRLYERIKENGVDKPINEADYDYIKVQAKYDVEIVKDGDAYKVLTEKEANNKPGLHNRLFKLNNEFMERLPYLDMNIASEKKVYDEEKAVIEGFFNNLLKLDRERMILLRPKWDAGYADFMDFISMLGINKLNDSEILFVDDSYKSKFSIDSFPLQINMEKVKSFNSINVIVHPGYSNKNKFYFVSIEAPVTKVNGMIGDEEVYMYDYFVSLKVDNEKLKIDNIKLNEYYRK